jgi:hypothetical protein
MTADKIAIVCMALFDLVVFYALYESMVGHIAY